MGRRVVHEVPARAPAGSLPRLHLRLCGPDDQHGKIRIDGTESLQETPLAGETALEEDEIGVSVLERGEDLSGIVDLDDELDLQGPLDEPSEGSTGELVPARENDPQARTGLLHNTLPYR